MTSLPQLKIGQLRKLQRTGGMNCIFSIQKVVLMFDDFVGCL